MSTLINGLITGILFGFFLQKGRVLRYDRQIGALRLTDMTIVKFMFSAILTGMVGVHILFMLGFAKPLILPTNLVANILGGLIFGFGWGLLGYCPGTSLGALGEGRLDAFWGMLGMLVGAGIFAELYPVISDTILSWGGEGFITLSSIIGVNDWVVIIVFVAGGLFLFRWLEKAGL
ncbi:MAG: YeeE/YedE thiosulfate transporter family protein [Thermodesulfovibrionia bacterium]|nr:YeeE/YedE thiosulfate transporter family protein [Thermodesulfovibrionia bacterium]